jgi:hypothetical protein
MSIERRIRLGFLCCTALFLCATPTLADPKPLSKEEQAKVDKAIEKAVAYLKSIQREKGDWAARYPCARLAQSLLPAYALLEAGVPANDPAIRKAADYLRPELAKYLRSEYERSDFDKNFLAKSSYLSYPHTYQLSLAVLFFDRLGDPKDKKLIQSLTLRLIAGQHRTGGWSYRCDQLSEDDEASLFKLLGELNKRLDGGAKPSTKLFDDLKVPRKLRMLTVFQDPSQFNWREPHVSAATPAGERIDSGPSDNSNTQFAMLALWVAQHHGVPLRPTLDILALRFERTQQEDGYWPYAWHHSRPTRSMVCVGLLGLAIGRRQVTVPKLSLRQRQIADLRVLKGLLALYGEVGVPTGQMERPVPYMDVYFLWSLERVGMLYDLPTLGDKEWYRWGAEILLTNQKPDGRWESAFDPKDGAKSLMPNDYPSLTTSFALLFLKRSHPMKDLTPKLPFKAEELNKSIVALRGGTIPVNPSSSSKNSKRQDSSAPPP